MYDIYGEYGTPKYKTAQGIYDALRELEQNEGMSVLGEMFPDVSWDRQDYIYYDEGYRHKVRFDNMSDYGE